MKLETNSSSSRIAAPMVTAAPDAAWSLLILDVSLIFLVGYVCSGTNKIALQARRSCLF